MNHQFEGMLSDIDRYGDQLAFEREREQHRTQTSRLYQLLAEAYGVRESLLAQLKAKDPSNPLVVDVELRKRIASTAANVLFSNRDADGRLNFERAKEVGRTFKIPGR